MNLEIKRELFSTLCRDIDSKIEEVNSAIKLTQESGDSETKSSAGDKYETGRAMLHLEMQNNQVQLSKSKDLKRVLFLIDIDKISKLCQLGSLVITTNGNFFLAASLGKFTIQGGDYFTISLASPIGKALYNRRVGDSFKINGRDYKITDLI